MAQPMIEGSSKQFFPQSDRKILMVFKDDIHGANRASSIAGTGDLRKRFSYAFYRFLEAHGLQTHLAEPADNAMTNEGILVKLADPVKIEILVRNVARGHWVDRHKVPVFDAGVVFSEPVVELCLKDKVKREDGTEVDDPRINTDVAMALHEKAKSEKIRGHMIESREESDELRELALHVNDVYRKFLQEYGWVLEDFKFEVGLDTSTPERTFMLIDEISPDCSRIRDKNGNSLTKDLFRARRPEQEIRDAYEVLTVAIEKKLS